MTEALDVKDMKLYAGPGSILADLEAMGHAAGSALTVEAVSAFDQLHYHEVDSVRYGIAQLGIDAARVCWKSARAGVVLRGLSRRRPAPGWSRWSCNRIFTASAKA